jgi:hypothetical protein
VAARESTLSPDEFDALEHIEAGRQNACVGRNSQRLGALKLVKVERRGCTLTPLGQTQLLVERGVRALRALAADPGAPVPPAVADFLCRKGHLMPQDGGYALTPKGRESIEDLARR